MANIELDGANKKIKVDSGDLTLDVPGDIILDADGADVVFADGGTNILKVTNSSSDAVFQPQVDAKDIKFNQYDGRTLLDINDGGFVGIANGATGPGQLRLYEDTDNGTNYTALQVGTQSGDITYTLPTADGSNGNALLTNGSGTLSWGAAGASLANDANNRVVTGDGSGGLNGEANLTFDGNALLVAGTAPSITIGDAGAEDTKVVFDGNAQDYHIGLDDSSDTLVVGLGSTLGTTSYLTIDSAGHARFPSTSCFQAYLNSDQSVSGSTSATVTLNTEAFDINADFNNSNYTFTAPVTGKYLLTTQISNYQAAGGSTDYVQVVINTSNSGYNDIHWEQNGKIGSHQVAVVADMDASDTATVSIHSHDDSSFTVRGSRENTFFSGILIG